jgi:arginine decarboxylase
MPPAAPTASPAPSVREHFSAGRLRAATWNQLRLQAAAFVEDQGDRAVTQRLLDDLLIIEQYWAYPGMQRMHQLRAQFDAEEYTGFHEDTDRIVHELVSGVYRVEGGLTDDGTDAVGAATVSAQRVRQHYFELLVVGEMDDEEEAALVQSLRNARDPSDSFFYDVVVVRTVEDALMALVFNASIQACIVRYGVPLASANADGLLKPFTRAFEGIDLSAYSKAELGPLLASRIRDFRPEVDNYYITDTPVTELRDSTLRGCSRIFYSTEDLQELHLTVLRGIRERYDTPFFSALTEYSKKPMGVFHAMPISRGNSVFKSRWIQDFGEFYGRNLFLAETSATTGGLDSLLQPTGPLKKAQELAAKAFGSHQTFFATNGTSSSNKIVLQALVEPGDVVLIDRDCHKSHHYGMVLSGAYPVYLHSYPLPKYSMYGAVPLEHIRERLLTLKQAGRLDSVKMLLLTNSTFDGVVYHVERVMEQVLAIKPDIVFLWDEAWFAFAGFSHLLRQRTAMHVAAKLHAKYKTAEYREQFEAHVAALGPDEAPRLPDPDLVRIRTYATQSTHKTLSSLRQGSMIHIWDEDFRRKSEAAFHEAYMTHTSTSPNYQILASLDIGRRQVELEGYELVEKAIDLGMMLRRAIRDHPKLRKWFEIIRVSELIPTSHRDSGIDGYYSPESGWQDIEHAWRHDEFALDPTKVSLYTGKTGIDGDTFKNRYLMDKYAIQINKTSRNSVLFMTNIGTTRGSVAYLTKVLLQIADDLEQRNAGMERAEKKLHVATIRSLTEGVPPLPDFSNFHSSFQAVPGVPGGNLRAAYFLGYEEGRCRHIVLEECLERIANGETLVSASFVIPYPPGFPVLVPGQVVNHEILDFLIAIDVTEIHGYRPELGLRLFTEAAVDRQRTGTAMGAIRRPSSMAAVPAIPTPKEPV